jgi:hypothetical protein
LAIVLLAATAWFAWYLSYYGPLEDWLFFVLAKIWGWQLLLTLSCASFGHLLLVRLLRIAELPNLEKLALSLALGLAAFVTGMYLGGFAHVLRPWYAVALPGVMLLAGARAARPWLDEFVRPRFVTTPVAVAATAFGALGIGVLYLGIFSPESMNYDAVWNHLVIAQDYAREGRIVPFPGDWVKNVPHLGSVVNTWAFLVPGFPEPAQRWMMALHDEFTVFLWTLVGVAAGARYLAGNIAFHGGWVALFLFPSIFVGGEMGGAADHFVALFAVPLFLSTARFLDTTNGRHGALLGAFAGAALLTKYQAMYLLVPIAGILGVEFLLLCWRRLRGMDVPLKGFLLGAAAALGVFVVLSSLHFGSNWVFFHNPFFPLAQGTFHSTPYLHDAQQQMDTIFADWAWHPPKELSERLRKAVEMVFTFSFKPHYSPTSEPTFGSLLTLLLPALPFIGRARKLWLGMGVCLGAVFVWAMTYWVDRNLQAVMPLMAAVVGALLFRIWQVGVLARAGVVALVALQVVWAGDWYLSGSDRMANAFSLIRSSQKGHEKTRFDGYRWDYLAMGKALPKDALLLLHEQHAMLGIDRPVLLDGAGFQGLVDYRQMRTLRDVYDRFRQIGVTHIVWEPGVIPSSYRQEQVLFDLFMYPLLRNAKVFGGMHVAELPSEPPPPSDELQVVVWDVPGYPNGVYPVSALKVCDRYPDELKEYPKRAKRPLDAQTIADALEHADAALIGRIGEFNSAARDVLSSRFFVAQRSGDLTVYGAK